MKKSNFETLYDLSPLQQGLLFQTLYSPHAGVYFEQFSCCLQGRLEVRCLEQAWQEVLHRHPVLRTSFYWKDIEKPVQIVHRHLSLPFFYHDWRLLSSSEQELHLLDMLRKQRQQGFALDKPPIMHLNLIRLDETLYQFIWSYHHILLDGWSVSLLLAEIFQRYAALKAGKTLHVPPGAGYSSYISWLRKQDVQEAERFWRRQLKGFCTPTLLDVDEAPSSLPGQEDHYAEKSFHLSADSTAKLQAFLQRHQLTLSAFIRGLWALLLSTYSRQDDVLFGAVVSGRPATLPGVEAMLGLFINSLPVRIKVPPQASLVSWLREIQQQQTEMSQFEYSFLMDIQKWSELPHSTGLFECLLIVQNDLLHTALDALPDDLVLKDVRMIERTSYPLALTATPGPRLHLILTYNTLRFWPTTIARFLECMQTLLESMISRAEQSLKEIEVVGPSTRAFLLSGEQQIAGPQTQSFAELFEAQVALMPEAVAVCAEEGQITYAELNRRANQVAACLLQEGTGPEQLVGLLASRSSAFLAAMLGIFKAGGAYFPLDPALPSERLGELIEDSGVCIILVEAALASRLQHILSHKPAPSGLKVKILDHLVADATSREVENPAPSTQPGKLAYVMYTSGSSGRPKGVLIEEHGMLNHLWAKVHSLHLHPDTRLAQTAAISFDISLWQLLTPLLVGAQVHLLPDSLLLDPLALLQQVQQAGISVLEIVPSLLRALLDTLTLQPVPPLPSLQWLVLTGEALAPVLCEQWQRLYPQVRLLNAYGPTECSDDVTQHPIPSPLPAHLLHMPIGRPLPNTTMYILDQYDQPAPVGVAGELFVGGMGVGRGYLGNAPLTAERFLPDPYSDTPGARFYKTGDLARYLPDGTIEFLGRTDTQVKVNGHRIELREIEAVLEQHPCVQSAVVLAQENNFGRMSLVAYLVPTPPMEPERAEIRRFLQTRLPSYMLPSIFVFLPTLPTTANGKIDRRALPPAIGGQPAGSSFVAPRTSIEEKLASIWSEVLRVERVSVEDNFFALGGDSILSIQIAAHANQAGIRISLKQIFECQTIAALAAVAGQASTLQAEQGIVVGPVPLTPVQQVFFSYELPTPAYWNQALLLQVQRELQPELLSHALACLLRHHDALRLRFRKHEHGWQQSLVPPDGEIPFLCVDLSQQEKAEQELRVKELATQAQASLDLSSGPLLRVLLFRCMPHRPDRLFIVIHHLAVDGVSWRFLLEDLQQAYEQLERGDTVQLPPKTTSFKEWSERLQASAQEKTFQAELPYWQEQAANRCEPLPVDHMTGENKVVSSRTLNVALEAEATTALLQFVPSVYHTQINDVLLSALLMSFHRWTKQPRLRIDLEGHGREPLFDDLDISRTTGWFTCIYPVVLELENAESPGEILKSVKEQLRRIPNHGIGYGVLRHGSDDQAVRESLRAPGGSEVSFNYFGQLDQGRSSPSLFSLVGEPIGPVQSGDGQRPYLLEVGCYVSGERFYSSWEYSEDRYRAGTVQQLAQGFVAALQELINHCLSSDAGGYTVSDFPDADIKQEDLEKILSSFDD